MKKILLRGMNEKIVSLMSNFHNKQIWHRTLPPFKYVRKNNTEHDYNQYMNCVKKIDKFYNIIFIINESIEIKGGHRSF